jgi:DNA-binding response OmpR family regulator
MTGYTDELPTTQGLVQIAGPVITKPFTPDILAERIRAALSR